MTDKLGSMTVGQRATLACLLEATIPKPGNVHRGADFEDTRFQDFLVSAVAIEQAMNEALHRPLGATILRSVEATRRLIQVNTNLGIILLLSPIAKCSQPSQPAVAQCLAATDPQDCRDVFQAIRQANPGGLGVFPDFDVNQEPPDNLVTAMEAASHRDLIARQYASGFAEVFGVVLPIIQEGLSRGWSLDDAVIHCHLRMMNEYPDSLIRRKNGQAVAEQSAALAGRVLAAGAPGDENYFRALGELDFWLRSDGNKRNPGTTADMITAGLFVGLRHGAIPLGATLDNQ